MQNIFENKSPLGQRINLDRGDGKSLLKTVVGVNKTKNISGKYNTYVCNKSEFKLEKASISTFYILDYKEYVYVQINLGRSGIVQQKTLMNIKTIQL